MAYVSYNPWTGKTMGTFPEMEDREIEEILTSASEAFKLWRNVTVLRRCELLITLAGHLKNRRKELAEIMATEMGKPVSQGLAEADKCALLCNWYAENAAAMLQPDRRPSSARESYICYEPQGIILGIMPWNFPFWQVFRFIVPALTGGNAALLKHASNVPRCAMAIEELVTASGYPEGLFRVLFPTHEQVSSLISSPLLRGVSLTGSNSAGSSIAAAAGKNLKKVVMELGGSDPFIVFPDASLEKAVEAAVVSRFQNCGQSCIAAKRLIIHADIFEDFRERLKQKVVTLKVGDPLDIATDIGPMVNVRAAEELERQLDLTLKAGAKLLCGGRDLASGPAVFLPAVVDQVSVSAPLACEEVFGPVAPLFRFISVSEAVKMANNTLFGLGASVWTSDERLALDVAGQIDTGTVAINGFVKSEPGLPFGGVKDSGYGRELGVEGIHEFLNIKTISIF
ncbi:MAG: NAD-dependent succinate-semialdehyde dehydrogenase [Bacteroidales bacterium]|jgi:succinate-semialdehyde dehydrogenase/glutarate-semialdehyde dehydrogenase|nr:NAD-dependent succinate-semialdehyde dehydrogenase [Bacteroidales bacterium]